MTHLLTSKPVSAFFQWWSGSGDEYDPFADEDPIKPASLRERSYGWFASTRLGQWLDARYSSTCELCGVRMGFSHRGSLCYPCYMNEKYYDEGDW